MLQSTFSGQKYPEAKRMYVKTNHQIEKWCNIIYTITIKLFVPILLLPKFIASFFFYFTTELGGDAFELPFPS